MERRISVVMTMQRALGLSVTSPADIYRGGRCIAVRVCRERGRRRQQAQGQAVQGSTGIGAAPRAPCVAGPSTAAGSNKEGSALLGPPTHPSSGPRPRIPLTAPGTFGWTAPAQTGIN